MKRNNLFMIAYILFIFIAFGVKFFYAYPMWAPIVTAITISSCIFTCADIADVVAKEYGNDVITFSPLIESAAEKCQKLDGYIKKNDILLTQSTENEIATVLLEGPETWGDTQRQIEKIQKGLEVKKKVSAFCKKAASPLVVLGFLAFFCTVTFESINMLLVPIQDYLSVFSFGVLMVTQFWGNWIKDEHIELEKNYNEVNKILDEISSLLPKAIKLIEQEGFVDAY